jgi:hypothetical protein
MGWRRVQAPTRGMGGEGGNKSVGRSIVACAALRMRFFCDLSSVSRHRLLPRIAIAAALLPLPLLKFGHKCKGLKLCRPICKISVVYIHTEKMM